MTSQCCGYGPALDKIANGYDCVMIPGAMKKADSADLPNGAAYGFCGGQLASDTSTTKATICC